MSKTPTELATEGSDGPLEPLGHEQVFTVSGALTLAPQVKPHVPASQTHRRQELLEIPFSVDAAPARTAPARVEAAITAKPDPVVDATGDRFRQAAFRAAIVATTIASVVTFAVIMVEWIHHSDFRKEMLEVHMEAAIGFPVCTCNAFATVAVLQATNGPIEFKLLGVEFKGAGGPLTLYVFTFLATVAAFHLLWKV